MVKTFSAFLKLAKCSRSNNQNFFGPEVFVEARTPTARRPYPLAEFRMDVCKVARAVGSARRADRDPE